MAWNGATDFAREGLVRRHGANVREAGTRDETIDLAAHRVDCNRADRIIFVAITVVFCRLLASVLRGS